MVKKRSSGDLVATVEFESMVAQMVESRVNPWRLGDLAVQLVKTFDLTFGWDDICQACTNLIHRCQLEITTIHPNKSGNFGRDDHALIRTTTTSTSDQPTNSLLLWVLLQEIPFCFYNGFSLGFIADHLSDKYDFLKVGLRLGLLTQVATGLICKRKLELWDWDPQKDYLVNIVENEFSIKPTGKL